MNKFNITWVAGGIQHHTVVEAFTKEEAISKFYEMASDRAIIVSVT